MRAVLKELLDPNSSASMLLLSHAQYHKHGEFLRTFWKIPLFFNLALCCKGRYPGMYSCSGQTEGNQPSSCVLRQSHFSTTECTQRSGSVATAAQPEPVDVRLQTPPAAETKPCCIVWMSSAAPLLSWAKRWLWAVTLKECHVWLLGAQGTKVHGCTDTEGNPARAPMVVTLTEVENNAILSSPSVIVGDFFI